MGYDYSYQILQELLKQGDVLDVLNTKFGTTNQYLTDIMSRLSLMESIIDVLTLLCVSVFGILLFNIIMKWVKK